MDLTTGELLGGLAILGLAETAYASLDQLLGIADLVKFAKLSPEVRDAQHSLALGRRFVHLTTPVQPVASQTSGDVSSPSEGGA
jgi:hypothetical protein